MSDDYFYFVFCFFINFKICFSAPFSKFSFQILSDHNQWQKHQLNNIGGKKPNNKSRRRIKAQFYRTKKIPKEPAQCPDSKNKKETDSANTLSNLDRETFPRRKSGTRFYTG